jgi:SNF2 family DNA or RNA helicase
MSETCFLEEYQVEGVDFLLDNPHAGLFFDCGLGKTPVTLTALQDLFDGVSIRGVLIVAPLRVARLVWPLEVLKWTHTRHMSVVFLHGPDKLAKLRQPGHLYTINYEGLLWLAEVLKDTPPEDWPFDVVVFDELTKMKSASAQRFKRFKSLIPRFTRRIGLTGTPAPNGLLDLYGQIYCLDGGQRLGTSFTRFRDRFFESDYQGYKYTPRGYAEDKIYQLIGDIVLRKSAAEYLDIPPLDIVDIEIALPANNVAEYRKLEKDLFLKLNDDDTVEAFNAAALTNKCLQFAHGGVYYEDRNWVSVHDHCLKALHDVVAAYPGEPLLVAYSYTHEAKRIAEAFPDAVFMRSGLSDAEESRIQNMWDAGRIQMLVCHPASAGHGLNLQKPCHRAFWYTLNWSYELYAQFNARLWRKGQTHPVTIHRCIVNGTVSEVVATALESKSSTQAKLLEALRVYRENKFT